MALVYLSGPIKADLATAEARFAAAEARLVSLGYRVANPMSIGEDLGREPTCEEYLRRYFAVLLKCDLVVALPDWEISEGAKRELSIAKWTGIPVKLLDDITQNVTV